MKKLTINIVRDKLELMYPQYDFSKLSQYINTAQKIQVICPIHGVFCSSINSLLCGKVKVPCPKCRREGTNRLGVYYESTNDFVCEYYRRWPDSVYDLSRVVYTSAHQDVNVVCNKHHYDFRCKAHKLMSCEHVCDKCVEEHRQKLYQEKLMLKYKTWLLENSNILDEYGIHYVVEQTLNELILSGSHNFHKTPIKLFCDVHGWFETSIGQIIRFLKNNESPCVKCRGKFIQRNYSTNEFIDILKHVYPDKDYTYDKLNYVDFKTKVIVTCPIHGDFLRMPQRLLQGRGCPYCQESLLERRLRLYFDEHGVEYIYQYRNKDVLGRRSLDFFIPKYRVGIECQGKQHLSIDSIFNRNNKTLDEIYAHDMEKKQMCQNNNIRLLYFTNLSGYNYFDRLITSEEELMKEILNET